MDLPGTMLRSDKNSELLRRLRQWVSVLAFFWLSVGLLSSCSKHQEQTTPVQLPAGTVSLDRTFHSRALKADVTYRVIKPVSLKAGERIRVGYLLHGNGGNFREWSASSSIADLAAQGYVLVMPEGHSSYFMNSATKADDRYEDFLTLDLIADAERELPQPIARSQRFIVGNFMGGFAAVVLALKHPELYGFAGALSPPVDFPRRRFTFRRFSQSLAIREIFGPEGSEMRSADDPFVLARKTVPGSAPFLFISVGDQESLRDPVERFNRLLTARSIPHVFLLGHGGHNWQQWNDDFLSLRTSLEASMDSPQK